MTELLASIQQALQPLPPVRLQTNALSTAKPILTDALAVISKRWYESVLTQSQDFSEAVQDYFEPILSQEAVGTQLGKLFLCSEFAIDAVCRNPSELSSLLKSGALFRRYHLNYENETLFSLQAKVGEVEPALLNETELMCRLRQFRQREMLRILFRDLNQLADLEETTRDLALLADACLEVALAFLHREIVAKYGSPIGSESGLPQSLVVVGMGKLGAYELNVSSDIDLIFAFPEAGVTDGKNSISNQEFFTKLGKALIRVIDTRTVDGFVFRVDMRLRPNGESGPLVLSFAAIEDYYQQHGREWERYALIKSRCVAGDLAQGQQLLDLLQPFVYRRYLDFGAIDALRNMKALIEQQVKRQNLSDDVKLGAGGIREIEFIVQSFQLIHGGRDRQFQQPHLLSMLMVLEKADCLPAPQIETLDKSYRLLRNTEHALQAWRDEQTQRLPTDDEGLNRLALALNFIDSEDFLSKLSLARDGVSRIFANIVTPIAWDTDEVDTSSDDKSSTEVSTNNSDDAELWQWLWSSGVEEDLTSLKKSLSERGYSQLNAEFIAIVQQFNGSRGVTSMEANSRDRLDRFMPLVLSILCQQDDAVLSLRQVLPFIESVLRRTAYLSLLIENPDALSRLVTLCSVSPWIAEQLARYPSLLDELLDYRSLFHVPDMLELRDELRQQLLRVQFDDQEGVMEVLRHFKLAHSLRVAACQINGDLPLMRISDYLTELAEVILNAVVEDAWSAMVAKYGLPCKADGSASGGPFSSSDFIVVGYGKLGGIELGPSSDLDLVFIHDVVPEHETKAEEGQRSITNAVFFARLGQRIIHSLHTATVSGALYEADMRLRPSGASGLLVSSFDAFARYQKQQAWVWEHQALVRARAVAGDAALKEKFFRFRNSLLSSHRDKQALREEVVAMREKMRGHLTAESSQGENAEARMDGEDFSLKQSRGGIVDIEFFVQYAVLAYAKEYPELTEWTDNIRLLDTLTKLNLIDEQQGECLQNAYRAYRAAAHLAALQQQNDTVSAAEFAEYRKMVTDLWQQTMIN